MCSSVKKVYIGVYGCQMNERDAESVSSLLQREGYGIAEDAGSADIILYNTCSVREKAEDKVLGKVGMLKRAKRDRGVIVGIIGCMAQNHGEKLLKKVPHVDFVVGTDQIHMLPQYLERIENGDGPIVRTEVGSDILESMNQHTSSSSLSAYVAVMRGCDRFCAYCIVPHVRGREKSRSIDEVVSEVRELAEQGTKEIFLLGQNITAYGVSELRSQGKYSPEKSPFADLLRAVGEVKGVERIRFTSPHPSFMNDAFMQAVADVKEVCESLHIPLQSGSDRILKAMRRGYTRQRFLDVVRRLRELVPDISFSTDVLVGFPGETDEDFKATRELFNEISFDMAYVFKYSPRAGTKAAEWEEDVPLEKKKERNQILLSDLERNAKANNAAYVNGEVDVLVEGASKKNTERWSGRSRTDKVCVFEPCEWFTKGDFIRARVDSYTASTLVCDPVRKL